MTLILTASSILCLGNVFECTILINIYFGNQLDSNICKISYLHKLVSTSKPKKRYKMALIWFYNYLRHTNFLQTIDEFTRVLLL